MFADFIIIIKMDNKEKKCIKCHEIFLVIKEEELFLQEKNLPEPEECPLCRQKRRLSKRSEQKFYNYKCDKCGKEIIIAFSPEKDQEVYCKKCYLNFFNTYDPTLED